MRKNTIEDFWNLVDKTTTPNACWEWQGQCQPKLPYGRYTINGKFWTAHRLSYTLTKGPITQGLVVMHSCDNPKCCRPEHLSLGTKADNAKDRDIKQRQARGITNGSTKLTEQDVLDIRNMPYGQRGDNKRIRLKYNLDKTTVLKIVNRITWKHI
jgi:hypothetical protein